MSTSAYYDWKNTEATGPSEQEIEDGCVLAEMRAIHEDLDATRGSPRMTKELRRRGFCVNHKRTERLRRENGIVAVSPRRSVRMTIRPELSPPLPDLVGGDFSPGEPNRRYAGDITYVPRGEGWLYLATVLDLGSRRPGGLRDGRPHAHRARRSRPRASTRAARQSGGCDLPFRQGVAT